MPITASTPSQACLRANSRALARYAALAQEAGIVPIVEPDVLMDGVHDIETCFRVTETTLRIVFSELHEQGVDCERDEDEQRRKHQRR